MREGQQPQVLKKSAFFLGCVGASAKKNGTKKIRAKKKFVAASVNYRVNLIK